MSQFPSAPDSDTDLPRVDGNLTEIGGDAINALRDAMFAVEGNIGTNGQGSTGSIAQRLSVSLNPDGSIKPSALAGIGLVYLPIVDSEISPTAAIQESKLNLIYSTTSLFNLYTALKSSIDVLDGFLALTGVKLQPHLDGINYNHLLSAIHVDSLNPIVKINPILNVQSSGTSVINRNNTNADLLVKDISDDLVVHEKADGTPNVSASSGGTVPPLNYAHNASGVFVNPNNFSVIPQSNNDLQSVVQFIDNSSLFLLGSRTQNLYAGGIPRTSRSSVITADGYGEALVPITPVVAYSLNVPPGPQATSPVDDINHGDDVVLFQPTSLQLSTFNFDAQFAQVKPGDIITINYGNGFSVQSVIDSTKTAIVGNNRTYAVRTNRKNLFSADGYSSVARIDKALFHRSKYGVLSTGRCPNSLGSLESLLIANPRSAMALGNGFNPTDFNATHYNLYLTLFATGDTTSPLSLPAIDVTGNQGITPGKYTLDNIIDAINTAFRQPGFNYRFVAFQYNGQIGIMLADPYNDASFSIISGTVDTNGNYTSSSSSSFPNNVVDNFNVIDPLGFGLIGANIASPPASTAYQSVLAAHFSPTLIFTPLTKSFFYTNGVERDRLKSDPIIINQSLDTFGDGYWNATILPPPATQVFPTRVEVTYQINLDLSKSGLAIGKTIVIQPSLLLTDARFNFRDYGRFIIKNVVFNGCNTPNPQTNITVYDGVHAAGVSPAATTTNIPVRVYFDDDSVGFDIENVFDQSPTLPYKRFFEVYVDQNGHTFTHERARFANSSSDTMNSDALKINLYRVSPKLRGYITNNNDKEIRLELTDYNTTTGVYDGYLARFNPSSLTLSNFGPTTTGKKGEIVRFYDETNIDFIDVIFDINAAVSTFILEKVDIQLFTSLELDEEMMLISSCQVDDNTKQVSYLKDERQFGNVSEEQFSTSAIDFINAPQRLLRDNGIIIGFDIASSGTSAIGLNGGTALVNGKIVNVNNGIYNIPILQETLSPSFATNLNTITWFVCVNDRSEIEFIASTDYALSQSATYGSLDHTRLFYVKNPNAITPTAYSIRSTYLSDLVAHKDLALIAIISATVGGSPFTVTSATITDARRFVANGYNGLNTPFVLSPNGNFRSFTSLNAWLNQLTNFKSASVNANTIGKTVIVKGQTTISTTASIDFAHPVSFIGDDGTFIIPGAQGFSIGNNITFDGVRFNYTHIAISDPGFTPSDLVNSFNGAIYCAVSSATGNKNITIRNCEFNSTTTDGYRYPFISFEYTSTVGFAENINILNNKFNSNVSSTDDIRAAICFMDKNTSGPTSILGTRLTSCSIKGNIGNKNHLIIISAEHDPITTHIKNAITPVGVLISENVCGAIGVLTRQDTTGNFVDGLSVKDKENVIVVADNHCKYIGSLDGYGAFINSNIDTISSSIIARDNSCGWIQFAMTSGTVPDERNSLTIKGNKLNALPASVLTNYGSTLNAAIFASNTGTNSAANSTCIITDNIIDFGFTVAADGITTTTNSYTTALGCQLPANITNNTLKGVVDNASTSSLLALTSQLGANPCIITGNKFIRGASNLVAYIDDSFGTGDHIITHNSFDSTVSNSSTDPLVNALTRSLSPGTMFERNKNQTAYIAIAWGDSQIQATYNSVSTNELLLSRSLSSGNLIDFNDAQGFSLRTNASGSRPAGAGFDGYGYGNYTLVKDNATNAVTRQIIKVNNLNNHVPQGAKITDIKMGVWVPTIANGTFDTSVNNNNYFLLSLSRRLSTANNGSGNPSLLDLRTNILASNFTDTDISFGNNPISHTLTINSAGDQATFSAATQYVHLTTNNGTFGDVSEQFRIGNNYNIDLTMEFQFIAVTPNSATLTFWLSPALIQFVW